MTHFISHQHRSQHTIPLCITIFQTSPLISATLCITPHLALHPILHCVTHKATFQITPYIGHMHRTTTDISHHTTFRILHNCIIPPRHLTVITPSSTSHYHVSRNTPHHTAIHHHILHHTTCHISHSTTPTTTYRAVSQPTLYHIPNRTTFPFHATAHTLPHSTSQRSHSIPQLTLCLIQHRSTFHIPCHSTRTNPHYTTTFHNPIPVWETRTRYMGHSQSWKVDQRGFRFPDEIKIELKPENFENYRYVSDVFAEIREMPQWVNASLFLVSLFW